MRPPRLEVAVDHAEAVLRAAAGGAERLELCSALVDGGLTPGIGLVEWAVSAVRVPVYCMVRPRAGGFCYSANELEVMRREIAALKAAGADGVVLGVLTAAGRVDVAATRRLIDAARPMRVVFHRAFDVARDLDEALQDVIACGADVLLTSGGASTLELGAAKVRELVGLAAGRIEVMGGAGVGVGNAGRLWRETGVDTLHASLRRPWVEAGMFGTRDAVFTVYEEDVRGVLEAVSRE